MKRRKLQTVLDEIGTLLADVTRPPRDYALAHAVGDLAVLLYQTLDNVATARAVVEVACEIRASTGPGSRVAEERLMRSLESLAWRGRCRLEDAQFPRLPGLSAIAEAPPEMQPTLQVLRELHDFAMTCFAFTRPRDAFGGRRRAMAFDILAEVGQCIDLPEVVNLARQALRKPRSVEARQAAEFLHHYLAARDQAPDDATTKDLLGLASRTDTRSTAFSALNALVETRSISEFEALDRLDDWKSRH
ncbi:MAG: hypothetical protein H7A45_00125 [Verrucomicrobiales bacterium]|nr:hypothetical protein [Verrucomicrobiales bacterium]MCP5524919.1 hypothetical protein [Verrucomicrobiales bacterium]